MAEPVRASDHPGQHLVPVRRLRLAVGGPGPRAPASATTAPQTTGPATKGPATKAPATKAAPTTAAPPEPKVYTCSSHGNDVVKLKKAVTDPMIVTTTWSGPEDNNTSYALDKDGNEGDLLVTTTGSNKGTTLINIHVDQSTAAVKVEGCGRWKIDQAAGPAKSWDGKRTFSGRARPQPSAHSV